jgi:hypothetical protein
LSLLLTSLDHDSPLNSHHSRGHGLGRWGYSHRTGVSEWASSMTAEDVEHRQVTSSGTGDNVALKVDDHVREHDVIYREA